jgi:signal recognition particle receptor subunit beta
MSNHKIIFTGPVGAGKSTAIRSLSDIAPVSTDEQASDITRDMKSQTTVAMDYGLLKLDGGETVHIYGTPGQERFDFMWDILTHGGIGLVLLINNARPSPFSDLDFFLSAFGKFIDQSALAIGVTQMDKSRTLSLDDYYRHLPQKYKNTPVFEVDARSKNDVVILVESLLYSLDQCLEA